MTLVFQHKQSLSKECMGKNPYNEIPKVVVFTAIEINSKVLFV